MAFSIAMSLIYIIFFGFMEGFPEIYIPFGFNTGEVGLTFLAMDVGLILSLFPLPYIYKRYVRREKEAQEHLAQLRKEGVPDSEISPLALAAVPPPEERLIHAMIGTWFMVAGLFWQGWTSILAPNGSPWPSIVAIVFVGMGVLSWFISSYRTYSLCRHPTFLPVVLFFAFAPLFSLLEFLYIGRLYRVPRWAG